MVASFAARKSTIKHDPTVQRIVQTLVEEGRKPTREETAILLRAIRGAGQRASVGTLEATAAEKSNEILSSEALRILAYLEYGADPKLSFDAAVGLLHSQVESSPWG
ncbi:hypothetical protein AB0H34_21855 [Saccharopolyspora shandongensis]|uniref:hypothetical protein n=1 Tax=Saccharopolyspora shandongensis TaxID=418495 RepID=UPI0033EACA44